MNQVLTKSAKSVQDALASVDFGFRSKSCGRKGNRVPCRRKNH